MNLQTFQNMDVNILLSIVNMQLRDKFDSLYDLCRYYDISIDELSRKLAEGHFEYITENNQFK